MDGGDGLIQQCIEFLRKNGIRDEPFLSEMGKPEVAEKLKPYINLQLARVNESEEFLRQEIIESDSIRGIEASEADILLRLKELQHGFLMRHIERMAAGIIDGELDKRINSLKNKGIRIDLVLSALNKSEAVGATWEKIRKDLTRLDRFIVICTTYHSKEKAIEADADGKLYKHSGFPKPDLRQIRKDAGRIAMAFEELKNIFRSDEYVSILKIIVSEITKKEIQCPNLDEYFIFNAKSDDDIEKFREKKIAEFAWMQKLFDGIEESLKGDATGDKRVGITPLRNFIFNMHKFIVSIGTDPEDCLKDTRAIARIVRQQLFGEAPLTEESVGDEFLGDEQPSHVLSKDWAKDIFKDMPKGRNIPEYTYLSDLQ